MFDKIDILKLVHYFCPPKCELAHVLMFVFAVQISHPAKISGSILDNYCPYIVRLVYYVLLMIHHIGNVSNLKYKFSITTFDKWGKFGPTVFWGQL